MANAEGVQLLTRAEGFSMAMARTHALPNQLVDPVGEQTTLLTMQVGPYFHKLKWLSLLIIKGLPNLAAGELATGGPGLPWPFLS